MSVRTMKSWINYGDTPQIPIGRLLAFLSAHIYLLTRL